MRSRAPGHHKYGSLQKLDSWLGKLIDALGVLSALGFCAIAVLIISDITVRYFQFGALPWATEVVEYTMFAATLIGSPWVLRNNGHVRMDAILSNMRGNLRLIVERVISILGFATSAVLLIYGLEAVSNAWEEELYAYKSLTYPEWLLLLPIPITGLMLCLEFLSRFAFNNRVIESKQAGL